LVSTSSSNRSLRKLCKQKCMLCAVIPCLYALSKMTMFMCGNPIILCIWRQNTPPVSAILNLTAKDARQLRYPDGFLTLGAAFFCLETSQTHVILLFRQEAKYACYGNPRQRDKG
jgi:hypothetical protein